MAKPFPGKRLTPAAPPPKMILLSTAALLPAGITEPTAWNAYKSVFSEPRWSLRFETIDPVALDIDDDGWFLDCLGGAGAYDYPDQARAHICSRIAEIVDNMGEQNLRRRDIDIERLTDCASARAAALIRMREAVRARIKSEIEAQFDTSVATWADNVDFELFMLFPEERLKTERFLGVNQLAPEKVLSRAVKYVFGCLDLRVDTYKGEPIILGKPRLKEVRAGRHSSQERERAWSLILRCADEMVRHTNNPGQTSQSALVDVRRDIETRIVKSGGWGVVDVVISRDRRAFGLGLPVGASESLCALVREQEQRFALATSPVS